MATPAKARARARRMGIPAISPRVTRTRRSRRARTYKSYTAPKGFHPPGSFAG